VLNGVTAYDVGDHFAGQRFAQFAKRQHRSDAPGLSEDDVLPFMEHRI